MLQTKVKAGIVQSVLVEGFEVAVRDVFDEIKRFIQP
jgi:hypothetical protein